MHPSFVPTWPIFIYRIFRNKYAFRDAGKSSGDPWVLYSWHLILILTLLCNLFSLPGFMYLKVWIEGGWVPMQFINTFTTKKKDNLLTWSASSPAKKSWASLATSLCLYYATRRLVPFPGGTEALDGKALERIPEILAGESQGWQQLFVQSK